MVLPSWWPINHSLYVRISDFFDPYAKPLVELCAQTGQYWGKIPPELFWYRRPGFHLFEYIVLCPLLLYWFRAFAVPYIQKKVHAAPCVPKPYFLLDFLMGFILALCWLIQFYFKATRPNPLVQLVWLAVPCHMMTLTWAWVLLQPARAANYAYCQFIASILSLSGWGPYSASAFPDWSDHQYWFERPMFYVHHFILLFLPHYWAWQHGIPPLTKPLLFTYLWAATTINFYIYTPLSYLSGINVNYNLHPHLGMIKPGAVMDTRWYRFIVPETVYAFGVLNYLIAAHPRLQARGSRVKQN